jgi:hypothetical protein
MGPSYKYFSRPHRIRGVRLLWQRDANGRAFASDWAVKVTSANLFPVDAAMLEKSCTPFR